MIPKIVLASKSLRRKDILEKIGISFSIDVSEIDEHSIKAKNPRQFVKLLSKKKAEKVAKKYKDVIVIGADTVVVLDKEIIGKPQDKNDAKKILSKLSNRVHLVLTGFTIIDTKTGKEETGIAESKVFFKKLSSEEINDYVETGEPLDKAGAYGIQDRASVFVKKIQGDYFNIVGLPVYPLVEKLKDFGVKVNKFWKI